MKMSGKDNDLQLEKACGSRPPKSILAYLHNVTSVEAAVKNKNIKKCKSVMGKPISIGVTSEVIESAVPMLAKPMPNISNSTNKEIIREPRVRKVTRSSNELTTAKLVTNDVFSKGNGKKVANLEILPKEIKAEYLPSNETKSQKFLENQKILCSRGGRDVFERATIVGVSYNQKRQPIYAVQYNGYDSDDNELITHDDAFKRFKPMPEFELENESILKENLIKTDKDTTFVILNQILREPPKLKERIFPNACPERSVITKFTSPGNASDCVIHFPESRLYVNKGLLSVYSPIFAAAFEQEKHQSHFALNNIKIEEFVQLLQAIYPSVQRGVINEKNIDSLLKLAYQFEIEDVMQRCENFLWDCRTLSAAKKLLVAQEYGLIDLMQRCADQFKSIFDYRTLKADVAYKSLTADTKAMLASRIADAEENKPVKKLVRKN